MNRTFALLLCLGLMVPYARGSICGAGDRADPGHAHESHDRVSTAGNEGAGGDASGGGDCHTLMSCDVTVLATDVRPVSRPSLGLGLPYAGIVSDRFHPATPDGPRPPPPRA